VVRESTILDVELPVPILAKLLNILEVEKKSAAAHGAEASCASGAGDLRATVILVVTSVAHYEVAN